MDCTEVGEIISRTSRNPFHITTLKHALVGDDAAINDFIEARHRFDGKSGRGVAAILQIVPIEHRDAAASPRASFDDKGDAIQPSLAV